MGHETVSTLKMKFGTWRRATRRLPLVLALSAGIFWGLTVSTASPAAAQTSGELLALLERIERLERELLAMRTVLGSQDGQAVPGQVSPSQPPVSMVPGVSTDAAPEGVPGQPVAGPQGLLPGGRASAATVGDPALARVLVRVDQLESELTRMTGELERLQYRYERLNTTVNQLAQGGFQAPGAPVDVAGAGQGRAPGQPQSLDAQQSGQMQGPAVGVDGQPLAPNAAMTAPGVNDGLPPLSGDVRLDYKTALDLLYTGEFAVAEAAFRRFVETYPDSDFLGEAHYWIGESFFVRELYKRASESYLQSARDYPKNTKAADSLLKLAFTFKALGEGDQACKALRQIVDNYPDASEPIKRSVRKARADFLCR